MARYDDELTFYMGDKIDVLKEGEKATHKNLHSLLTTALFYTVNDEWYHGALNGCRGIFPKSYVEVQH